MRLRALIDGLLFVSEQRRGWDERLKGVVCAGAGVQRVRYRVARRELRGWFEQNVDTSLVESFEEV